MSAKVAIRISEVDFFKSLGHAFASHFSVVRELIQNARRAGSPLVRIFWDETKSMLTVEDEGQGVSNFQDLLTVARSGWNQDTKEEERPWGTGFMAALYAAKEIIVESNGKRLQAFTSDLLEFNEVDILQSCHTKGTRVTLIGVELNEFEPKIKEMMNGYPIPVFFNGIELERPYAIGASIRDSTWISTSMGIAAVRGVENPKHCVFGSVYYLQGFEVARDRGYWNDVNHGNANIVHLDSQRFTAVYPDRDRLNNEEEVREQFKKVHNTFFRHILDRAKADMDPAAFILKYWGIAKSLEYREIINDLNVVPASVFKEVSSCPFDTGYETDYETHLEGVLSRNQIEQTQVFDLSAFDADDLEEYKMLWMLIYGKQWLTVSLSDLHADHWLRGNLEYIHDIDDDKLKSLDLEIEINEPGSIGRVNGDWIDVEIQMCKNYTISSSIGSHIFDNDAIGLDSVGIVYPNGEASGTVAKHFSDYHDSNNFYQEGHADADENEVIKTANRLRITDPTDVFMSVLASSEMGQFDCVTGKAFIVVPRKNGHQAVLISEVAKHFGGELPDQVITEIATAAQEIITRHAVIRN